MICCLTIAYWGSAQLHADHHSRLRSFLHLLCSRIFVLVEGYTVIFGITWHLAQVLCQPYCNGTLVRGDRFCQALELPPPDAQCDRRLTLQVIPPACMVEDGHLAVLLRVADRGCIGFPALAPGEADQLDFFPGSCNHFSKFNLIDGGLEFICTCSSGAHLVLSAVLVSDQEAGIDQPAAQRTVIDALYLGDLAPESQLIIDSLLAQCVRLPDDQNCTFQQDMLVGIVFWKPG